MSRLVLREDVLSELHSWACGNPPQQTMLAVVTGHATMGKSVLLDNLARRAAASGTRVFRLAGMEGWQHIPYALVEQLSGPSGLPSIDPARLAVARQYSEHGAQPAEIAELLAASARELAQAGPLLFIIDDIQHADADSLFCLRHLHHRVVDERVKIVCARRSGVDGKPSPALADLLHQADAGRIDLDTLSVGQLRAAIATSGTPAPTTEEALREHSGGNPLLTDLLLARARRHAPSPAGSALARSLGRATLTCIYRMGPRATQVARGIAVLGDASDLRLLSMLCQVSMAIAERAVDQLRDVGLLNADGYRNGEAGGAIVRDIDSEELVRLRVRAASILSDEAAPRRAADQLLLAGVVPDESQVSLLRQAAERAITANELWRAAQYLDLARRCCPAHQDRHAISTELAYLHWLLDPSGSASRITALAPAAVAGELQAEDAHLATCMALWHLQIDVAAEVADTLSSAGDDSEPLRATQLLLRSVSPGAVSQLRHPLADPHDTTSWPNHLANRIQAIGSLNTVLSGNHNDSTRAIAEQTLLTMLDSPFELSAIRSALLTLIYGEWLDAAQCWINHITVDRRWQSVSLFLASGCTYNALIALRRNNLVEAAEQSDQALDILADHHNLTACLAYATYIEACALLGEHQEAARASAKPVPSQLFKTVTGAHYLHARATQHLVAGQARVSLNHFAAIGDQLTRWGVDAPTVAPWRLGVALAFLRLGEQEHAAQLMHQQLRASTGRYPLVERRTRRLLADNHLDADSAPTRSPRPTTVNEVIVRIPESRTARFEHAPANLVPSFSADLSEAEQRVANLASEGLSNREIGERLYLTISTVEQHLTKVYRKLHIRNRNELRGQLPGTGSQRPDSLPTARLRAVRTNRPSTG